MNINTYMTEADRTTGGDFHDELVTPSMLIDAIDEVSISAKHVDKIKKALFYGRQDEDLAFTRQLKGDEVYSDKIDKDLIHAVLGIYTEAAELLELLRVCVQHERSANDEELRPALLNEAGDVMWYQALLFKLLGTDFEEVGNLNIAKLRKRFPVKFTEDLAVNRDEAKENVVFE